MKSPSYSQTHSNCVKIITKAVQLCLGGVLEEELKLTDLPRILVVDDSEFSRKCIIQVVEERGFKVVGEAYNATRAIEAIASTAPNIIIIDLVMPDVSGVELTRYIKENFKKVYIITVSSLSQEYLIMESLGAGAVDFMQKPLDPGTLESTILRLAELVAEDNKM